MTIIELRYLLRRMFWVRHSAGGTPEAEREFVWKWSPVLANWTPVILEKGETK